MSTPVSEGPNRKELSDEGGAGHTARNFAPLPAIELVAQERIRQVRTEGHTREHDDEHTHGELMAAAACYISAAMCITAPDDPRAAPATYEPPVFPYWPWEPAAYKPSMSDAKRNLVKAAALIVAEIERLQRLAVADV